MEPPQLRFSQTGLRSPLRLPSSWSSSRSRPGRVLGLEQMLNDSGLLVAYAFRALPLTSIAKGRVRASSGRVGTNETLVVLSKSFGPGQPLPVQGHVGATCRQREVPGQHSRAHRDV